jgi:hypothetical protein
MEPVPASWTSYRASKPAAKGCRVNLWLLPNGSGFAWDVLDDRERLIKRSLERFETPGAAMKAGTAWIEANKEEL